jgi:uncharacterized protein (DUF1684 family)
MTSPRTRRSIRRIAGALIAGVVATACSDEAWPDPPPVDSAKYEEDYSAWRNDRQQTAEWAVRIVGIWPLPEGESAFGADRALPIVLPARVAPARAGAFRRRGERITVVPVTGTPLFHEGSLVISPTIVEGPLELGSVSLEIARMGEANELRHFITAWDANHPDAANLPQIDTYPLDDRFRVAARFERFDAPKPVRVADVRGGVTAFTALGEVVFRLSGGGGELRLTAFGEPEDDELFVMFKDATNATTTYGGYRMLTPKSVPDDEWTVLDFNLASNPPCAYSAYTTCPLPPPENKLAVPIEAGEKRYPAGRGYLP